MKSADIISLVMSLLGVVSFCAVFTILFGKYVKANVKETKEGKRDIELIDREITEQDVKAKRRKKAGTIISNILFYGFLALITPAFAFALINKAQGNLTGFGNESMLVVASGSMSFKNDANSYLFDEEKQKTYTLDNQFAQYDMIFVTKVHDASDIHLYDVVAFYNRNPAANAIYIHRVIDIKTGSDGVTRYVTRGDANNATDNAGQEQYYATLDDIKGVYNGKKIQGIGMLVMFFQSPHGIITILSVAYSILMFNYLAGKIDKAEEERVQKLSEIVDSVSVKKDPKNLSSAFRETIYYGGYAYHFNEAGFLSKEVAPGSGNNLKKVVTSNGQETSSSFLMGETPIQEEELMDTSSYEEEEQNNEEEIQDTTKDYE